eukprot:6183630-Pleurochrysis_carterae.AAC.1
MAVANRFIRNARRPRGGNKAIHTRRLRIDRPSPLSALMSSPLQAPSLIMLPPAQNSSPRPQPGTSPSPLKLDGHAISATVDRATN